jgi:serine protease Do
MDHQPEAGQLQTNEQPRSYRPMPDQPPVAGPPSSAEKPGKVRIGLLSVAFLVLVSGAAGFAGGSLGARSSDAATTVEKQQVVLKSQGQLISDIADKVGKSVVSIETTTQSTSIGFFGQPSSSEEESAGTGIILSDAGLIMTNRHVVPAGTTTVNVVLADGTRYENVKVIGRTSNNDTLDVAFLQIEDTKGKKLAAASLGDSGKTNVGDTVIAIGNALGQFQNTVTSGIISGYGRSVTAGDSSGSETESLENLIQTDTAINPGNSGGPLVNLDGQVIGINTAVAGDAQNIGFAIPINDVKGLVEGVTQSGKLERPYLGVVYVPLTADLAKQYDLEVTEGAYVPPAAVVGQDSVIDGSPADRAGIRQGDIITKVAGQSVDSRHSLTSRLGTHKVGDTIDLTVRRDGKQVTINVTLGAAPQS